MTTLPEGHKQYLEYVRNTAGNATVAIFDEDWEPIGPMLRRDLMPRYFVENEAGKLVLTDEGQAALKKETSPLEHSDR